MDDAARTTGSSRGLRVAFRLLAGLLGAAAVVFSVPFAVISFFDDAEAIHRFHNTSGAIGFGVLTGVALVFSAWRPEDQVVAFRLAAAVSLGGLVAGAISGDLVSGGWFIAPVAIVVLWAVHPSRAAVLRLHGPDPLPALLGLAAFVPGTALALTQAELQRNGVAADPHWEFHHYSGMVTAGLGIPLALLVAAFPGSGRRLWALVVGGALAALGVASLALSDHVGAFDTLWAWAALAGGVVYGGLEELPAQQETSLA